ncbi:Fe-S oxidoreductase [Babesia caballi]|uniref:Fe-S oxidoreductase n=1 Tax=Babesia caballi TaxID=5871 RepID=A0AAV4LRC9_BABCB|nr:Fe-S oxidoreductase [Babesia caballi]
MVAAYVHRTHNNSGLKRFAAGWSRLFRLGARQSFEVVLNVDAVVDEAAVLPTLESDSVTAESGSCLQESPRAEQANGDCGSVCDGAAAVDVVSVDVPARDDAEVEGNLEVEDDQKQQPEAETGEEDGDERYYDAELSPTGNGAGEETSTDVEAEETELVACSVDGETETFQKLSDETLSIAPCGTPGPLECITPVRVDSLPHPFGCFGLPLRVFLGKMLILLTGRVMKALSSDVRRGRMRLAASAELLSIASTGTDDSEDGPRDECERCSAAAIDGGKCGIWDECRPCEPLGTDCESGRSSFCVVGHCSDVCADHKVGALMRRNTVMMRALETKARKLKILRRQVNHRSAVQFVSSNIFVRKCSSATSIML